MFQRYAVYFTPKGALARAGAAWLGWDVAQGQAAAHPQIAGLDLAALTQRPRKYGLHGTIKAPFFLAEGTTAQDLRAALGALCQTLAPCMLAGFEVTRQNAVLALTPTGDESALAQIAAAAVQQLDRFRAPPSGDELARRRRARLSPQQEAHLQRWGYPYVLDQFHFHITLSGRIKHDAEDTRIKAQAYFAPYLNTPLPIDSLTLAGQDSDGMFHEIERFALTGQVDIS